MSDLSKMEVKECPMCGAVMVFDGIGGWDHGQQM